MVSGHKRRRGSHRQPALQRKPREAMKQDPQVWKACAGWWVQIPAVDTVVYYFPQGHLESVPASSLAAVSLSPLLTSRPCIPCRVVEVLHLADPDTDEAFAKIRLEPLTAGYVVAGDASAVSAAAGGGGGEGGESDIVSFAKCLTPSDANNGGGFSVPRFCADSIFPKLDFEADPPVQNIQITDVHGDVWEFRHIYRGTPRRHLLTTGWSKFVNAKMLIATDTVVFMKSKTTGKLFVGIRRALKPSVCAAWSDFYALPAAPAPATVGPIRGGFSRDGKGRVPVETVVEAAETAAKNLPFEVVYYPRAALPNFVVAAEKVNRAMSVFWSPGARVKIQAEADDTSRLTWYEGTVASVVVPDGLWKESCWRMLQVNWDEPKSSQNMRSVSPWEVEYVTPPTPPIPTVFPPSNTLTSPHNSGLLTHEERDTPPLSTGISSVTGQSNPSSVPFDSTPAGMQGARQIGYFDPMLQGPTSDGRRPMSHDDNSENMSQRVKPDATDLNERSSSPETASADSHSSVQSIGADTNDSILLFGRILHRPGTGGHPSL